MSTRVRSYAKVNLGLAIGPPRPDGFHGLCTLYQTLAVHDLVTVSAERASTTSLHLTSNDRRVPTDARNTAWKMAEGFLKHTGVTARVTIHIEKRLPIQGGMGAGSANAAATLLGLERELGVTLAPAEQLSLAAAVGSDVPLFLIGGAVLGTDRGQVVTAVPDGPLGGIACVVALPDTGVSTPLAFREWDRRWFQARGSETDSPEENLHSEPIRDTLSELSRAYASCFPTASGPESEAWSRPDSPQPSSPEKQQEVSGEQHRPIQVIDSKRDTGPDADRFEHLIHSGKDGNWLENDFETVVFPQNPALATIKQLLIGGEQANGQAAYAALSGSGSALFGLYKSSDDAGAAQQRLQQHGVKTLVTKTIARPLYWSEMFEE